MEKDKITDFGKVQKISTQNKKIKPSDRPTVIDFLHNLDSLLKVMQEV